MTDMTVSKTILSQLGGGKFMAMTGAKNFVGSDTTLSFRLPGGGGFCKGGINCVRITLEPSDTYTVEFLKIRGMKFSVVSKSTDVYAESLQSVFTEATGLATSLGSGFLKSFVAARQAAVTATDLGA